MKKRLKVFLSACLVLLLASCDIIDSFLREEESETYRIGVCRYDVDDFFDEIYNGMEQQDAADDSVSLTFIDVTGSGNTEREAAVSAQILLFIEEGYDAVLYIPYTSEMALQIASAAADSNVKVGYVLMNVVDESSMPENAFFTGFSDYLGGKAQMEYAVNQLNETGNVCILKGIEDHTATDDRTQGYLDVIQNYSGITILESDFADFDQATGKTVTQGWLSTYGNSTIDAIISNNDSMIMGAQEALSEAGITNVVLVGLDGVSSIIDLIASGEVDASVTQDASAQGELSVELMSNFLKGESIDEKNYISIDIITAENVEEYQ